MRIIGNIQHPHLKITVFKMDNKLSVKFESGLYEQTYKFRISNTLATLEDVQKLVDVPFLQAVEKELQRMHEIRNGALSGMNEETAEEEFPTII